MQTVRSRMHSASSLAVSVWLTVAIVGWNQTAQGQSQPSALQGDVRAMLGKDLTVIGKPEKELYLETDRSLSGDPLAPLPHWVNSWKKSSLPVTRPAGDLFVTRLLTFGI